MKFFCILVLHLGYNWGMRQGEQQPSLERFVEQLMDFLEQKRDWLRDTLSRDEWNILCKALHECQERVSENMPSGETIVVINAIFDSLTINSQVKSALAAIGGGIRSFPSLRIVLRGTIRISRTLSRVAYVLSNRLPEITGLYQPIDADLSSNDSNQHQSAEHSEKNKNNKKNKSR